MPEWVPGQVCKDPPLVVGTVVCWRAGWGRRGWRVEDGDRQVGGEGRPAASHQGGTREQDGSSLVDEGPIACPCRRQQSSGCVSESRGQEAWGYDTGRYVAGGGAHTKKRESAKQRKWQIEQQSQVRGQGGEEQRTKGKQGSRRCNATGQAGPTKRSPGAD